jgi:hypothetical protein
MKRKRYSEEKIISIPKEHEAGAPLGGPDRHNFTGNTCCARR